MPSRRDNQEERQERVEAMYEEYRTKTPASPDAQRATRDAKRALKIAKASLTRARQTKPSKIR